MSDPLELTSWMPVYSPLVWITTLTAAYVFWSCWKPQNSSKVKAEGKAVLITGCDTGFGLEAAKILCALGFTVYAGCLKPQGAGAKQLKQKNSEISRIIVLDLDVTDQKKIDQAINIIQTHLKQTKMNGLWAVLNNAGIYVFGQLDWQTTDQCEKQVQINLMGTIRVTKACIPLLKLNKGSRIVNVSSFAGRIAVPFRSVYSATKYAVEGFSDALRPELHRYGIHVSLVEPSNHSRITSVCKQQLDQAEEMWQNLSADAQKEYELEFWKLHRKAARSALHGPRSFEDTTVLKDIIHAISNTNPRPRYPCGTWWDVLIFKICCCLPTSLVDFLMNRYSL